MPIRRRQGPQPLRRDDGEAVQGRAQCLPDTFEPVEPPHGGQDMRGIRALAPSGPDQFPVPQDRQQGVEQQSLDISFDQTRTELAEDGVVEAGIGQ